MKKHIFRKKKQLHNKIMNRNKIFIIKNKRRLHINSIKSLYNKTTHHKETFLFYKNRKEINTMST